MSGHSKWHNTQAKKGKADAARGRIFTKLGREIAVAARGNPNPATNSKLADVIAKAKAANMPNDNIERSIKRAAGELGDRDYKELTYEGYGVGRRGHHLHADGQQQSYGGGYPRHHEQARRVSGHYGQRLVYV